MTFDEICDCFGYSERSKVSKTEIFIDNKPVTDFLFTMNRKGSYELHLITEDNDNASTSD
jgi:hypothetical protein